MAQTKIPQSADRLTLRQCRLVRDLEDIGDLLGLDYRKILDYESAARTPKLESIARHLIIGEVVRQYTLVDEYLNMRIAHFFFGKKQSFIRLWRTKKFGNSGF